MRFELNAKERRSLLPTLLFPCLVLSIALLWLAPLPSSFWIDEIGTAFITRYGVSHPSLSSVPQLTATIYYCFPRMLDRRFGYSEIAYRIPSLIAMALALLLVAQLARRLIHPQARWFAVFACLALRGINYQADDARPYALGSFLAAAALLFLVRWLDDARWRDALLFVLCAVLLWRVHLIYWPLYLLFAGYALLRLCTRDTPVGWVPATAVFAAIALLLLPVLLTALSILRQAKAHVMAPMPSLHDLEISVKLGLVLSCAVAGWLWARLHGHRRQEPAAAQPVSLSAAVLIAGWWLLHPLCLFAFSRISRESLFMPRYLSVGLPGAALAATLAVSRYLRDAEWKPAALVLVAGVFLNMAQWRAPWPRHESSDWRAASRRINAIADAQTPVICPSPFLEAKPPAWRPDYPLPGFFYAHLAVYPIRADVLLFPFGDSREAEAYATTVAKGKLLHSGRFILYGGNGDIDFWRKWFRGRREFAGWKESRLGPFGDVEVIEFQR